MPVFLIANATANSGRAAGLIPAARAALERADDVVVLLTKSRGDEKRCAQHALSAGATAIAVLGGDGTISQVACELVRQQSKVPLAILGAGTGNDFAKSLNAPIHDFAAMSRLIANHETRTIDAGKVDNEIFVNSAGFGFDAEVVVVTNRPGARTGKLMYARTALSQLFNYRGFDARITPRSAEVSAPDHCRTLSARWLTLVFANGGYFGGAFRIAPGADMYDGTLDSVFIRDVPPLRRLSVFARALAGRHIAHPDVATGRNSSWTLEFHAPPVYQVDGELRQAVSATVTVSVIPMALRLICPE